MEQLAVSELVAGVQSSLRDPLPVARLKADPRLAEVVAFRAAGLFSRTGGADPEARGEYIRASRPRAGAGRSRRCASSTARPRQHASGSGWESCAASTPSTRESSRAARSGTASKSRRPRRRTATSTECLERAWPAVTPEKLVRSLFTTPAFLAQAAGGVLDGEEQKLPSPSRRRLERGRAARRGARARRRAGAHIRPRDRRRGAGSRRCSCDDRPPRARRRADDPRDAAQGTGPVTSMKLERRAAAPPAGRRRRGRGAQACLPGAARDRSGRRAPLLDTIAPGIERPPAYRAGAAEPLIRQVEENAAAARGRRGRSAGGGGRSRRADRP